jgi:anti-sigma B factor antagonist
VPENAIEIKDSLNIKSEKIENVFLLKLKGFIDTYNSLDFQKEIRKLIDENNVNLLFSCSELTYVSSTGIGAFANLLKVVKMKNGNIILSQLQPKVYEVFSLLGFTKIFTIVDTDKRALEYFKAGTLYSDKEIQNKAYCPNCSKQLDNTKTGKFRCSQCKSIVVIDAKGNVTIE